MPLSAPRVVSFAFMNLPSYSISMGSFVKSWLLPSFLMGFFHQICQGDAVQVLIDPPPQLAPEGAGGAGVPLLAGGRPRLQAGHRGQVPLGEPQNVPHPVLLRGPGEPIAAPLAVGAGDVVVFGEHREDFLQVLERNLLPLGHVLHGGEALVPVKGQIHHHPQGVAASGGHHHI